MLINGTHRRTIWPADDYQSVQIIDQRRLPFEVVIEAIRTYREMVVAIRDMHLRGAPLIGAAAGYGVYLACLELERRGAELSEAAVAAALDQAMAELNAARPTAVNLRWAVERQRAAIAECTGIGAKTATARRVAEEIAEEDVAICAALGRHGAEVLAELAAKLGGRRLNILTHCNAGWLATVDYGTVTAGIYEAAKRGLPMHVWVDETRPRNQGALTSWELSQNGIPNTVIVDNAGGHIMQHGLVDVVIVGTDRTAANGDVANKIGTYLKALAAHDNGVPFYVALPSPSFDPAMPVGVGAIPIEERDPDEVVMVRGLCDGREQAVALYAPGTHAANHAFDVTPARLVTGYITERGVFDPTNLAAGLAAGAGAAATGITAPGHAAHEGTIKFTVGVHRPTGPLAPADYADTDVYRTRLWKLGLIGFSETAGVGYGNISTRRDDGRFLISGTQTGHKPALDGSDYVIVDSWDFAHNQVNCTGPCLPSSEALSHAALYQRPEINVVIHVHSRPWWDALIRDNAVSTEEHIPYGSEMLFRRLAELVTGESAVRIPAIIVAKGHEEGVFIAGRSFAEAFSLIEAHIQALETPAT